MGRRERITHTEKIIYILLSQTETERAVGLGSLEFGAQFEKSYDWVAESSRDMAARSVSQAAPKRFTLKR